MDCIDWLNEQIATRRISQESLRDAIQKAGFAKPSQPTISRILSRETPNPGYKTINALIRQCGGDPDAWMKKPDASISKPSLSSYSSAELADELHSRLIDYETQSDPAKKLSRRR